MVQVDSRAYQWPMVAFGTALMLNLLTLLFERKTSKFELALVAMYINLVAAMSDYLNWQGRAPIVRDAWGQGVQVTRMLMWLWTTPAMVYLLSAISGFTRSQVSISHQPVSQLVVSLAELFLAAITKC